MKNKDKCRSSEKRNKDECLILQHYNNAESITDQRLDKKENVDCKRLAVLSEDNNEHSDVQYIESMNQATTKKKGHNKSFKKILEEGFPNKHGSNSELATDQLVPKTKRKHKYSNILDAEENLLLEFDSTDEPAKKTKKSHKHQSPSKKRNEDYDLSNQYCLNSETAIDQLVSVVKRKGKHSKIFDTDKSSLLQHKYTDQPVPRKKSHKNKSSKKNHDAEGILSQYCSNSETAMDNHVPETKIKHKHSKIIKTDESLLLQDESTDRPVKKKKKSHKHKSSKKLQEDEDFPNGHCLNSETAPDHLVSETERVDTHSNIFGDNESLHLLYDQLDTKKTKSKRKKSAFLELHEHIGFSKQYCSEIETDQLISKTMKDHKCSKILDADESLLLHNESTDQPVKKKKKSHKHKSSKKLQDDEDFPNRHCLNWKTAPDHLVSETERMEVHSNIFGDDESLHLLHDQLDTKKNKCKRKKLPFQELTGFSKQYCSEIETDQLVSKTMKDHKCSKILDADESLLLHNESTDQPVRKKKKSHKNKSFKKNHADEGFSNQCSSNMETSIDHLVPETKIKHKHSKIFNTDESHLLQFESTDQLVTMKKKSHKNKSSKKIHEDEGFSQQYLSNSENIPDHLVPESKRKLKHSNILNPDGRVLLQYESIDQHVKIKKKSHKNKSNKLQEDEESKNLHPLNSEPATDQLVSGDKHKCSNELNTDESLLLQHSQNSEDVNGHTLCHNKKMTHKSKSSCKKLFDNDNRQGSDNVDYDGNISTHCNSSGTIPESIDQGDSMILENEVQLNCDSSKPFSPLALDFTEEPINFTEPLLHSNESVKILDEGERNHLKSNGVIIKTGRYSAAEDAILKRNYEDFIKRFGVNDPHLLLGIGQKYRNKEGTKFLKAKHFYVRLGKDLNNRSLRNVYMRARLLFDPLRGKCKFDDEEVTHIKKVHKFVGNRWTNIGNTIDRNANSTRSAFLWHDKLVKTGKWPSEERSNLLNAIRAVTGTTDLSKVQSDMIPWEKVAELVPTRNFFQCRLYWLEDLSWTWKGKEWNQSNYSKLISILGKECFVEDFRDVDWKRVQKCFCDLTGISPSWEFLRKKLYSLKRYVPAELKVNYKEMLNFLCKKYGVDSPL